VRITVVRKLAVKRKSDLAAGRLPPAATPESEQFGIAVLAYLLLTGFHPIETPAVQDEMLRRIAERPPLPFAARGVAAWPQVEAVLARGLAAQPDRRFPDVSALTRSFASVDMAPARPVHWPAAARHAFDSALETVRRLLPPSARFPTTPGLACARPWLRMMPSCWQLPRSLPAGPGRAGLRSRQLHA